MLLCIMNKILCIYAPWRYIYYALLYMFTLYNVMNMLFNLSTTSLWSVCVCESHLTDHRTSNINLSGKIKCLIWSSAVRLYVILMTIMLNITIIRTEIIFVWKTLNRFNWLAMFFFLCRIVLGCFNKHKNPNW